jgi:dihydroorotate dehydrogenase (fumarate)
MGLATELAGLALEHPVMNAAGTCKTVEDVERFARSAVAAIVIGSITLEARNGNPGNVYWAAPAYSLNAPGLPNRGAVFYREALPGMAGAAHAAGKPVVLSIAGFSPAEYRSLATVAVEGGADVIELNLGCPNVWTEGLQKRMASFDPPGITTIVEEVAAVAGGRPVGIKLSPFSDPEMLAQAARVIERLPVRYVTASNTFPNAMAVDPTGAPMIGVGFGGLSGAAMKPVGLGQVRQLRHALPPTMQVVGAGGIQTGQDVLDYLAVGASAVQVSTAYWNRGEDPTVFGDILAEYVNRCAAPA